MKFTVLGMGKTGHTVCAYLLQQGQTVTAWDRDAQKLAVLEQSGIRVSGALEGHFPIHTESSLADAVADSKYILVMTTAESPSPNACGDFCSPASGSSSSTATGAHTSLTRSCTTSCARSRSLWVRPAACCCFPT